MPNGQQTTNSAAVVVDIQNDYCHADGVFARAGLRVEDLPGLLESVDALVGAARAGGAPVIWVEMVWDEAAGPGLLARRSPFLATEGLRRGTWGAELVDGLTAEPGDIVVEKHRFSAFYDTDLERRLRELGCERLVVCGVRTDFCVESTVRDAMFRDFDVVVPREAVAGYIPALHEHSLRLMSTVFADVTTLDQAVDVFRSAIQPQTDQEA